jgi:acyl-CoA reductase-like NAD-dependent aldehyde dehydrogenase
MNHHELLINGHFIGGPCDQSIGKMVVYAPWDGSVAGTAAEAGWPEVSAALDAAEEAFQTWRKTSGQERAKILNRIAEIIAERADELIDLLTVEVGKPKALSLGEVTRLRLTFELAAKAALKMQREAYDISHDARSKGAQAFVESVPIGPVLGIVPYNWPFNLAAHKVAPALAAGCTITLKASSRAPMCTLALARICHEAGVPAGVVNAIACENTLAERACLDPRVKKVSFTGSPKVGWMLAEKLGRKPLTLELGGNASAILFADANLDSAVEKLVNGAFAYAGQICISVQHIWVHESVYEAFKSRFAEAVKACRFGNPRLDTVSGPLIDNEAATKVREWVQEAVEKGAKVVAVSENATEGADRPSVVPPTVLENVSSDTKLACQEVFGPVVTLGSFSSLEEVIQKVNSSEYGIHAAAFTQDESAVETLFSELEVVGLVINDSPSLRFDNLPYGGVKRSGLGLEGVEFAIREMTRSKSLVLRDFTNF